MFRRCSNTKLISPNFAKIPKTKRPSIPQTVPAFPLVLPTRLWFGSTSSPCQCLNLKALFEGRRNLCSRWKPGSTTPKYPNAGGSRKFVPKAILEWTCWKPESDTDLFQTLWEWSWWRTNGSSATQFRSHDSLHRLSLPSLPLFVGAESPILTVWL